KDRLLAIVNKVRGRAIECTLHTASHRVVIQIIRVWAVTYCDQVLVVDVSVMKLAGVIGSLEIAHLVVGAVANTASAHGTVLVNGVCYITGSGRRAIVHLLPVACPIQVIIHGTSTRQYWRNKSGNR